MRPSLTPWLPGYDIFLPGSQPKTSSFQLPYQQHSSSVDCARELCKPSKNSASLLVCNEKFFLVSGFLWVMKKTFWVFHVAPCCILISKLIISFACIHGDMKLCYPTVCFVGNYPSEYLWSCSPPHLHCTEKTYWFVLQMTKILSFYTIFVWVKKIFRGMFVQCVFTKKIFVLIPLHSSTGGHCGAYWQKSLQSGKIHLHACFFSGDGCGSSSPRKTRNTSCSTQQLRQSCWLHDRTKQDQRRNHSTLSLDDLWATVPR